MQIERKVVINLMRMVTEKKQPNRQKLMEEILKDLEYGDNTSNQIELPVLRGCKGA